MTYISKEDGQKDMGIKNIIQQLKMFYKLCIKMWLLVKLVL